MGAPGEYKTSMSLPEGVVESTAPGEAYDTAFLAGLKLGDALRMNGNALVRSGPYDRMAVVTDIVDGNVTFMIVPKVANG